MTKGGNETMYGPCAVIVSLVPAEQEMKTMSSREARGSGPGFIHEDNI